MDNPLLKRFCYLDGGHSFEELYSSQTVTRREITKECTECEARVTQYES